jgi:hypothetical protein
VKHKARLVSKGYMKREGIDFEVFTPDARMEPVWLLMAMVAIKDWQVRHMDFKSTFLNGELMEEVLVCSSHLIRHR